MARTLRPDRIGIALLTVLMTAAGAPLTLCAAMPGCPAMAPPASCHGPSHGERHCAPSTVVAGDDDCCTASAQQGLPAAAIEKLAMGPGSEAPLATAVTPTLPPPARNPVAALGALPAAPSGRALLSLHHTLLI